MMFLFLDLLEYNTLQVVEASYGCWATKMKTTENKKKEIGNKNFVFKNTDE